jgi:hypothetical protein
MQRYTYIVKWMAYIVKWMAADEVLPAAPASALEEVTRILVSQVASIIIICGGPFSYVCVTHILIRSLNYSSQCSRIITFHHHPDSAD